ncbi:MAG: hypothetical protein WC763_04290 [Candidatus Paceibacterota bacterium]|jgi:hypothetical protein
MGNHREEIARFKDTYQKIGSVACPYFGGEKVYFNKKGFDHLLRKGRRLRLIDAQLERLDLIDHAKTILEMNHPYVEHRETKVAESIGRFWGLRARVNDMKIKLVIRQIGNGRKHFFSIYKIENAKRP